MSFALHVLCRLLYMFCVVYMFMFNYSNKRGDIIIKFRNYKIKTYFKLK